MKTPRYLDHNASAPVRPEVIEAVREALEASVGNPSSMHLEGRRSAAMVDEARRRIAAALGVDGRRIVFTSGATESNNLALRGAVAKRPALRVITSAAEHVSMLATVRDLAAHGTDTVVLPVDAAGSPFGSELMSAAAERFSLVSLGWAGGETGHILDAAALLEQLARSAIVHLDAAQIFGRVPLQIPEGVDMLSLSAHKIGGPAGVGLLIARAEELHPLITGGPHERGLRAGTENVAGIVGMAVAVMAAVETAGSESVRLSALRERIWARIAAALPDVLRITPQNGLPNTLTMAVAGIGSDVLIAGLDLDGFCVSSGSACAAGSPERSHVIEAIGTPERYRDGVVRVSMGWSTEARDVEEFPQAFERVVRRAKLAA